MNTNFLKNPIIIGIIAGVLTYGYMYWEADRKHKENPKVQKRSVGLITPAVVSVIVWFLASSYLDNRSVSQPSGIIGPSGPIGSTGVVQSTGPKTSLVGNRTYKLVDSAGSFGSESYRLIGKNNIKLPPTDVFIDLARF